MGASESKLVFKQGIFRLSEEQEIPADDPYWTRVSDGAKSAQRHGLFGLQAKSVKSFGSSPNQPRMYSVCLRRLTSAELAIVPCPISKRFYSQ